MKLRIFQLSLFMLLSICIFAVDTNKEELTSTPILTDANVTGHVVDKKTREHLPYVSIYLKGTTMLIHTDATGHYYLKNLPIGTHTLIAKMVGYKTKEVKVLLTADKLSEVNFELEEDAVMLESVVVSSNRIETSRKEAASVVNILTPFVMESTNAVSLSQGLSFQPGLRVETNCQNCGFQQVRINGLDGAYSQIMIDSRPLFSALAGVYGLEHIPTNMIERVEVVRGGGSAIFGSNAIGGTINIITKEPKTNSMSFSNVLNMVGIKKPDNNFSLNASLVSDDFKTGAMIFGSSRQRSGYDHNGDGFTEVTQLNSKNIGLRSYYNFNYYNKLSFEYHHINEFRRGGNSLSLPPHEADIAEQLEHNINSGNISFNSQSRNGKHKLNLFLSTQYIDRKSYYGAEKDLKAYGRTDDQTWIGGAQYNLIMDKLLFMPATLTLGAEHHYNGLQDNMPGYNRSLNQKVNISSIFAQNEWKNNKLSLLLGGRLDKHNMLQNLIFSPRINARYNPAEFVNLRAGYAGGFRGPQAFDEDMHITAVGGNVSLIKLNPTLKPEFSNSFSASADFYYMFGNVQTNLLIEGFYTRLQNKFVLNPVGRDSDGNLIQERQNGGNASVQGINIEGRIVPSKLLQLQLGFTIQRSMYEDAQAWSEDKQMPGEKRFLRTPNEYGFFTANITPIKPMNISLSGVYTGRMLVPHLAGFIEKDRLVKSPSFFDLTLKASYDFNIGKTSALQINAGMQNLLNSYQKDFDKGEKRDAGYIYGPSLPRTLFVGLKYSI